MCYGFWTSTYIHTVLLLLSSAVGYTEKEARGYAPRQVPLSKRPHAAATTEEEAREGGENHCWWRKSASHFTHTVNHVKIERLRDCFVAKLRYIELSVRLGILEFSKKHNFKITSLGWERQFTSATNNVSISLQWHYLHVPIVHHVRILFELYLDRNLFFMVTQKMWICEIHAFSWKTLATDQKNF